MELASQSSSFEFWIHKPYLVLKMKVILLALFLGVAVAQHYGGGSSGYGPDGVRNRYFILGHGKVGPLATSIYGPSQGHNSYRPSGGSAYGSSSHAGASRGHGGYGGSSSGHGSGGAGYGAGYGAGSSLGHGSGGAGYGAGSSGLSSGIYGPSANYGGSSGSHGSGGYGSSLGYGSGASQGSHGASSGAYGGHGGYGHSAGAYGPSTGSAAYGSQSSHGSYGPSSSHGSYAPAAQAVHVPARSYSAPSHGHGSYAPSVSHGSYGGSGSGSYGGSGSGSYGSHDDLAKPTPYEFGYNVHNEHGDQINRQESGDGHGNVKGSYGYRDGYGVFRHVDYTADHAGFRANVRTNEPGTDNQDPADVHMQVEHGGYGGGGY